MKKRLDKLASMAIPLKNKKKKKLDYKPGQVIQQFYDDLRLERITANYMPRSDLAYITYLVNNKFGKTYSFQEVNKLLKECLGAAIDG